MRWICRGGSLWCLNGKYIWETSLAVQWLGLHASTTGGTGSIPGQGTKMFMFWRGVAKKLK